MRKIIKLNFILMVLCLTLCSNLLLAFADTTPSSLNEQLKDAEELGKFYGEEDGRKDAEADFVKTFSNDYKRNMLSTTEIDAKYKLDPNQIHYRNYFVKAYKKSYQEAYEARYKELYENTMTGTIKRAHDDGVLLGDQKGLEYALYDFIEGKPNDWQVAFNRLTGIKSVEERYYLNRDSKDYRDMFLASFSTAFQTTYKDAYRNYSAQSEFINVNVHMADMYKKEFPFEDIRTSFVSGIKQDEKYKPVYLSFEDATLYKPTPIALSKLQNSFNMSNFSKLVPVSSVYHVSVRDASGACKFLKPVKLTFEYMGSEYAGIYQYINGQWIYMPSTLSDGMISTYISEGDFESGLYAVFIDQGAKNINIKRAHWAKNEMYTLARRGISLGTSAQNPSKMMTRIEFSKLLYQIVKKPQFIKNLEEESINFVTTYGYLSKDAKNQFSKYDALTYGAFEKAMTSYLKRPFKWLEIEEKMLREKFIKSKFNGKLSNSMPSDEVYYAIMYLIK